jgi:molybdopterin molybdotransferase
MAELAGGCGCDSVSQALVPYEEALERLLAQAVCVGETQALLLNDALGRVLAKDIVSQIDVPPADNTSMDGYAIRSADVMDGKQTRLKIDQRITAGETGGEVSAGTAARIFTGAPIPPGADAVIMQEQVTLEDDEAVFDVAVKAGQNIRPAGQDIRAGQTIMQAGTLLRPQELGLAASIGIDKLEVYRRPRVGIFFTGDELVDPGRPLKPGQIYDSNRYTLNGLLASLQCDIIDLGIVGDTLEQTVDAIQRATAQADLVITSGGVSVGEEDHVRIALEQLGELKMWKLNIKPGKPLALGLVNDTSFIGLPGNPVSVFATFGLFVSPFIKKMQGRRACLPRSIPVVSGFDWPKPDRRREFARARLVVGDDNIARAELYPNQCSGVLMSTSWADGFVIIPENRAVATGDPLGYLPFSELFG